MAPLTNRVVMMTRYPVPGAAKLRLAEALGPGGAAMLHRDLAAYCYRRIVPIGATREADVEVRFDGGSEGRVASWLGPGARFRRQGVGDLGDRLAAACADAFSDGCERVVVLGSDCPDAGAPLVRAALHLLEEHPLVLGPAEDGGYYLIGLSRDASAGSLPALFGPVMPWGGADVFSRTRGAAADLGLSVGLLPTLRDIDVPEDLVVWQEVRARLRRLSEAPRISVVIPTWNESETVAHAVRSAIDAGAHEILVSDAGSVDRTTLHAEEAGATVVRAPIRGRFAQMNSAARFAHGDVLLFMHADTRLPSDAHVLVRDALAMPGAVAGCFQFGVADLAGLRHRLIDAAGKVRSRFGIPYGDQGLFLTKELFDDLGGFPHMPIMEDYELALRLKRLGRIVRVPAVAPSSTRAWDEHGLVRTTARNLAVITGYRVGVPAERLAEWRAPITTRGESLD